MPESSPEIQRLPIVPALISSVEKTYCLEGKGAVADVERETENRVGRIKKVASL